MYEYRDAISVIRELRKSGYSGHVTIGQHFATFNAKQILMENPEIDSVVRFEGELPCKALLVALKMGEGLDSVPNLVYRSPIDGHLMENRLIGLINDLDVLPFPARDVLFRNRLKFHSISISGSRGCPWHCKFCSISTFYRIPNGRVWRARSAHNIIEEIENLIKQIGIRRFTFVDDQFMGDGQMGMNRADEIANEIISRNLNIEFSISCRPDSVDEHIFLNLRKAGLYEVFLGVESGFQPTLDYLGKQCKVESNKRALDILRKLGLRIIIGFIMFHEYSTLDEIQANLDFLEATNEYDINAFFGDLEICRGSDLINEKSQWSFDNNYFATYHIRDKLARSYRQILQETLIPLSRPFADIRNAEYSDLLPSEVLEDFKRFIARFALNIAKEYLSYFYERGEVPGHFVVNAKKNVEKISIKLSTALSASKYLMTSLVLRNRYGKR